MRPSATAGEISGVAIGTALTSSPGLLRMSLSTRAGAVWAPVLRLYPMRSVPSSPAPALRAVSHARSSAASAGGADSANAAPAVVSTTLRVLRTSRAVPSPASSRRIPGAECGLGDTDPCGRAGEVQLLRQHQEVPQAHRIRRHAPSPLIDNDPF